MKNPLSKLRYGMYRIYLMLPQASALFVIFLVGCEVTSTTDTSRTDALSLPVADVHMHAQTGLSASELKKVLDRNVVRWVVGLGGSIEASRRFSESLGVRWIPFGNGFMSMLRRGGVAVAIDPGQPEFRTLLGTAEQEFAVGHIKGYGEISVNSLRSSLRKWRRIKFPADAPTIKSIYDLVARFNSVLSIHMQADPDSIGQLEGLLRSDRRARVILAHCAIDAEANLIRSLLERHLNLYCDFAGRYPPLIDFAWTRNMVYTKIFDENGIEEQWKKLIEDYPDRFLVGTDITPLPGRRQSIWESSIRTVRIGLLANLSREARRLVAFENAKRLFNLR